MYEKAADDTRLIGASSRFRSMVEVYRAVSGIGFIAPQPQFPGPHSQPRSGQS
jgi:hypothetical protein